MRFFLETFPANLKAALCVVTPPARASNCMAALLTRMGRLPASGATDGQPIEAGNIYVAVPEPAEHQFHFSIGG